MKTHSLSLVNPVKTLILALMVLAAALLFSCGTDEKPKGASAENERLIKENQELRNQMQNKENEVNAFIQSFNEIESNLETIKEREKLVKNNTGSSELQRSKQDQIVEDINAISELLVQNREKVTTLKSKLSKSGNKISELEKLIDKLMKQLEEKDNEIALLKEELERSNSSYKELFIEYVAKAEEVEETREELTQTTNKLNTAFFAYGTTKELLAKNVITKEGGFIGIGKAEKLRNDFNKDYFTQIDITKTKYIDLKVKKAKLITTHPANSYKFEMNGTRFERLLIINPEDFWAASKYLVLIVE